MPRLRFANQIVTGVNGASSMMTAASVPCKAAAALMAVKKPSDAIDRKIADTD